MNLGNPIETIQAANLEVAVEIAVERLEAVIEKWQDVRRLARHEMTPNIEAGWQGVPSAPARWDCAGALVAGLFKCKAFRI